MNNYLVVDGPGLRNTPGLETGLLKYKIKQHVVNGPGVGLEKGLLQKEMNNYLVVDGSGLRDTPGLETGLLNN